MTKGNQTVWLHRFGQTKEFASAAELTLYLWSLKHIFLKDCEFTCIEGKYEIYIHLDELIEMAKKSSIRRLVV